MQLTPGLLRRALVAAAAVIGTFQVALAAGAPLGALAWGGSHPGVLPSELRAASAASAVGVEMQRRLHRRPGRPCAIRVSLEMLCKLARAARLTA